MIQRGRSRKNRTKNLYQDKMDDTRMKYKKDKSGTNRFETKEQFKYLGAIIASINKKWWEIQVRITAANKTYTLLEIMKFRD